MSAENKTQTRTDQVADTPFEETDDRSSRPMLSGNGPKQQQEAQKHNTPSRPQEPDLTQLRRLLLGKDYERLTAMRNHTERMLALEEALRDPVRQTDRVATVLSEAMLLRETRDQGISKALRTSLSDAIKAAVRKNPQPVIEAVSPVIGPAIRRSVNDAIASMLELFEQLLEHNLSWQAMQWRIEAWRTGRRYSEVVLLRTLIYRVEQVLLIHRETGLLLEHVEAPQAGVRDPDLVGSMLAAIKDFVSDSFSATEASQVQTMQVGDYKVIVEQGQLAIIAAIARGNPPTELARTIQETSETIEILYRDGLKRFDGDASSFSETRPLLEECLKSQQRQTEKRRPWLVPSVIALMLSVVFGFWGFKSYQAHGLWTSALDALRAEPGIVLTDASRDGDIYHVHGLRDHLAREPEVVIGAEALSGLRWRWNWQPFISLEPELLLARVKQALQPPPAVALSLDDGVLMLSGEAPQQWIDTLQVATTGIPGIHGYRDGTLHAIIDTDQSSKLWTAALQSLHTEPGVVVTSATREGDIARIQGLRDPLARDPREIIGPEALSALQWEWDWRPFLSAEEEFLLKRAERALQQPATVSLSVDGSVLHLSGKAPKQWIDALPSAVRGVPGITEYQDDGLKAIDLTAKYREMLALNRAEIESTLLYFDVNAVQLGQEQLGRLDTLATTMKALTTTAHMLGLTPRYLVTGYADATGSKAQNRRLGFSRARGVIEALIAGGVSEQLFLPLKMGVSTPAGTPEERARNRRVKVDVIMFGDGNDTSTR